MEFNTEYLTLSQRKAYVEALKKEPKMPLTEIYTFDIENLSKDERDLLLLESEVFFNEVKERQHNNYLKNKDYHIAYNKEYYGIKYPNKYKEDKIALAKKYPDYYVNKTECEICGGKYVPIRLRAHLSTKKHINGIRNLKVKENARFIE